MDHILSRERETAVDPESGTITSDEAGSPVPGSGDKLAKTFFYKFCRGFMSVESVKGEHLVKVCVNASNRNEISPDNLNLVIDMEGEKSGYLPEKKMRNEKHKKTSAKKAPKPPRPPRGLSLDAADHKFIKEIAELAMIKRSRIERMKALKKMKAEKASSSSGSLFAMLFTILFCLVILFQGMSTRSSAVSFQGSPESARAADDDFALVQNQLNSSASKTILPISGSLNLLEQVSGSDSTSKVSKAAG